MTLDIIKPQKLPAVLPWGMQIQMLLPVPELKATGNRNIVQINSRTRKRFIRKDDASVTFRAHIAAAAQEALGDMKRKQPELAALHFPIWGSEFPLRIDVVFCFCDENRGVTRMERSDEDNLKKGVYDGIKGVIIDDDNWIVEGYWAKGKAPKGAVEDAVLLGISRAGFREWGELEMLARLPVLAPWRVADRTKVLAPQPGRIVLPH